MLGCSERRDVGPREIERSLQRTEPIYLLNEFAKQLPLYNIFDLGLGIFTNDFF